MTGDNIIAIIAGIGLPVVGGWMAIWNRLSSRLGKIEMKLQRLTDGQATLSRAQTTLSDAHSKFFDADEELDDAIAQLNLANTRLQERMSQFEVYRGMTEGPLGRE